MISPVSEKDVSGRKTKRVLYVDDMRELREVARLALTRAGHKVDCAPDGSDAFEMVKANPAAYDIVISDHHMGGMNGLELVMKLREIQYPGMIAIVSSELNSDVEDEYRQLGIERILNKPVELAHLRALVLEAK
ncbi:MAG TPA: response regulator [Opitutaceae bacterium]|jgi:CheY-like chemotaxis protein|nr:response regulator [Opitutaceae bacterium]